MCSPTNSNNKTTNDKKFHSLVSSFKGCQIKKKEVTPRQPTCRCQLTRDKRLSYESSEGKGPTTANNMFLQWCRDELV